MLQVRLRDTLVESSLMRRDRFSPAVMSAATAASILTRPSTIDHSCSFRPRSRIAPLRKNRLPRQPDGMSRSKGGLLVRDYIQRALYSGKQAYFSKEVVQRIDKSIPFTDLIGEADYRKSLAEHYSHSNRSWLTPVEIFQPYYARAIARSVIERHRRLYPGEPVQVLEFGGGNGTCAAGFLSCMAAEFPDEWRKLQYTLVEISEPLAAAQSERLRASGIIPSRFEVLHEDVITWAESTLPREGPWFVIGLEVLDNLPHDKLRVHHGDATIEQAYAFPPKSSDASHIAEKALRWTEVFRPLQDEDAAAIAALLHLSDREAVEQLHSEMMELPLAGGGRTLSLAARLTRLLRPLMNPNARGHDDVFVPTTCRRLLQSLSRALPEHQLTLADFNWLPPQPCGSINAPLVQAQTRGHARDFKGDIFAPAVIDGECDVFFATHFGLLETLCAEAGRSGIRTDATASFMAQYADLLQTETRCGYNPLIEDFANTSILTTGSLP